MSEIPSVSDLVLNIKKNLEGSFRSVSVVGEVTNLSSSSSGHWYLSLSDSSSLISGALFKMDALRNPIIRNLKDGDKVICSGAISVYAKRGTFQLIIKRITPIGKGDLKERFERLKKKLGSEGLFDLDVKNKIPELPKRIAVITAQKAAALQDFINIVKRRSYFCDIVVSPALVQGESAPASIRKALEKIIRSNIENERNGNSDKLFDVVVLTRGGGSLEDLWAFNDEALAWDIFNCPIPIISAVGHQVDYSISDFVADLRCETPSAAAEILTNKQKNIKDLLENSKKILISSMKQKLSHGQHRLISNSPKSFLDKMWLRLHDFEKKLSDSNIISRKFELVQYEQSAYELDLKISRLKNKMNELLMKAQNKVKNVSSVLTALNPSGVLSRGYAYTELSGKVLSSKSDFDKITYEQVFAIHLNDCIVKAKKAEKHV